MWGARNLQCTRFSQKEIAHEAYLARGSQGSVVKARVQVFGVCVLKYIDALRNKDNVTSTARNAYGELFASHLLGDHPNVVSFYGTIVDDDQRVVGFVSEYMEGGNLIDVINRSITLPYGTDENAWIKATTRWAIQIARVLSYPHFKNVIHGDVKPENTLLSKDLLTIKLCDFGASVATKSTITSSSRGTILYMAPEMLKGLYFTADFGPSADVFSYAMFLYTLFHRKLPFISQNETPFDRLEFLEEGIRPLISETIPEEIRHIMEDCWPTDPMDRATMKEVTETLENYWDKKYPGEEF